MKPNIPYTPSLLPLDGIDYNLFHRELTKATQAITKYSAALQSTKIDTDLLLRISHVLDYNFSIATIKTLNESTAVLTSYEKDEEGEFYNEITFKKK